eukprot:gene14093-biopygen585
MGETCSGARNDSSLVAMRCFSIHPEVVPDVDYNTFSESRSSWVQANGLIPTTPSVPPQRFYRPTESRRDGARRGDHGLASHPLPGVRREPGR